MKSENFILLEQLCSHYQVEMSFFNDLSEIGLIEISPIEESHYVHVGQINVIEKSVRMHHDLNVNIEGIDVVLNLLGKIDALQAELLAAKNRLLLYEND